MDEMSNKEAGQMQSGQGSNKHNFYKMRCNCTSHMVLRWVIGIVILLVVFFLGVMVGRFHGGYGSRGMMMNRGGMYRQGMPMMRAFPGSNGGAMRGGTMPMSASTTPTTTAK